MLQVNIRWKSLDEIYKMYILVHRSDLKISTDILNIFSRMNHEFRFFFFESASNFAFFLQICGWFFSWFRDKFQRKVTCVFFFESDLRKRIRKLSKILKSDSVKTFHYYSFFIIIHLCPRCWAHRARPRPRALVRWPRRSWPRRTEVRAWCLCENQKWN